MLLRETTSPHALPDGACPPELHSLAAPASCAPPHAWLLVCPASGRSFANLVGRIDDGLMVEEGAREEVGRLRDVFEGGYYAETEAALLG